MKQGDKFIKLVMILLAAAVLAYFGYGAYQYFKAPVSTVTALEYEASLGVTVPGYLVRQETQLSSAQPITIPTLSEGAHASKGETIAVSYVSTDAKERMSELSNLQEQIAQLTYACSSATDLTKIDAEISSLLTTYQMRTALHQSTGGDDVSNRLKGLIVRSTASSETLLSLKAELSTLQQQLTALTSQTGSGATVLTASDAGYFSGSADGYETVLTPDRLDGMTNADFEALSGAKNAVPSAVYGKLITSDTWYYVAEVPTDKLGDLKKGDTVTLHFARDAYQHISMTVDRIGGDENGKSLLILSGDNYIQNVTLLREQTCTLVFQTYSGLRVPKSAIHVAESGESGVYVLEGALARWKSVEILYAASDHYVVRLDESSTGNLWPGDQILLGSGFSNGKVVNQK